MCVFTICVEKENIPDFSTKNQIGRGEDEEGKGVKCMVTEGN